MSEPKRIVFMGSDPIALPMLKALAADSRVRFAGVFTQPDRPSGRGQKLLPNAIKQWAGEHSLPVLQPAKLTEADREALKNLQPDIVLVMAYGHLLRQAWIDTPSLGMYNLHTSELPKYRGASPIQSAIANGEPRTGVTLMQVVLKMDAGPIVDFSPVSIEPRDTGGSVDEKLAEVCPELVLRNLDRMLDGSVDVHEQDEERVTFTRKLRKEDGVLDFAAPAAELARRINGLFPWPGTGFDVDGHWLRTGLATCEETPSGKAPGTVLEPDDEALRIATGLGVLRVLRLQRVGGRMLSAPDFLRGFAVEPGTVLECKAMPPLVSAEPFRAKR